MHRQARPNRKHIWKWTKTKRLRQTNFLSPWVFAFTKNISFSSRSLLSNLLPCFDCNWSLETLCRVPSFLESNQYEFSNENENAVRQFECYKRSTPEHEFVRCQYYMSRVIDFHSESRTYVFVFGQFEFFNQLIMNNAVNLACHEMYSDESIKIWGNQPVCEQENRNCEDWACRIKIEKFKLKIAQLKTFTANRLVQRSP